MFFGLLGFGLAFVPIEERPLDVWLTSFVKRVYLPTQYVWKKQNLPPEILLQLPPLMVTIPVTPTTPPPDQRTTRDYISSLTPQVRHPQVKPAPPPTPKLQPVPKPAATPGSPPGIQPPPPIDRWTMGAPPPKNTTTTQASKTPTVPITGNRVVFTEPSIPVTPAAAPKNVEKLKSDYQTMTHKLADQIASLQKELAQGSIAKERVMELQQVLMQLLDEKERLTAELVEVKRKLDTKTVLTEKPKTFTTVPDDTKTTVRLVSPQGAVRAGMPRLTSRTNVITGIIKDSHGTLLPNLIITVKDKEDVPVRALKTNKLGQFAASTPLPSGTYIIEIEDPKKTYQFNRIEVTLVDQVLPPLDISAISERDIVRQKLSRELFGKNNI